MKYSKAMLSIMLIPKIGKVESTMGKTAQWIAQATEVVIPNASQLTRKLMATKISLLGMRMQQSCK
jgi:hypothetical protein